MDYMERLLPSQMVRDRITRTVYRVVTASACGDYDVWVRTLDGKSRVLKRKNELEWA